MPKKIKYDSDSDSDKPKKKNKTKTKKTKKEITIKNKNKNKIIININSGKKGKKEKVQKLTQTQTRPQLSMGTNFISGNPIDKNYEIELSRLKNQINELNNKPKPAITSSEEPRRETILINPPNQSNFVLDNLKRGALGVGNYILEKARNTEGYVIKKVKNSINDLENLAHTIGSKIIHKATDGTISLFEKSVNGLISLGSYTLSKTGEGLNILLKSTVDSYSTPLTDPTLQQTNLMDTVDDPTLHQTNLMGNNDDDDLPPIEVSSDVDPNNLNEYGYPNIRTPRRLIPPPIRLDDFQNLTLDDFQKDDDDDDQDDNNDDMGAGGAGAVAQVPKSYKIYTISNIDKLMGVNRDTNSLKGFLKYNGDHNYDDLKYKINIGSRKDAAEYIKKLVDPSLENERKADQFRNKKEQEKNERLLQRAFFTFDINKSDEKKEREEQKAREKEEQKEREQIENELYQQRQEEKKENNKMIYEDLLSQIINENQEPQPVNISSLVTPSAEPQVFRDPEESNALLSSYFQPVIFANQNDNNDIQIENQNDEVSPISQLPNNDIDESIIPQEIGDEEIGTTAKPKRGRPKLSEDEKLKKEQDKLIIQQVKKAEAEAEAKRKNKPKSTFGTGRK
jgi:hypothetical protein